MMRTFIKTGQQKGMAMKAILSFGVFFKILFIYFERGREGERERERNIDV